MQIVRSLAFACLILALMSPASIAQEWADFKARFIFDGKVPERKTPPNLKIEPGAPKDLKILDESLIVDEKTKGIANILIWVIPDPDKPDVKMPIHPSYTMAPPTEHVVRYKDHVFSPHVSIMRTDAKVLVFLNEAKIAHNTQVDSPEIPASCRSLPVGNREPWEIKQETRLPATISCAIHTHEKAYLLVRDNPYFAVSNEKGEIEIQSLPVGEWRFKVWHEKAGYITDVKLGKSDQKWPKGEFKIKVEKIDFYLGDITVPAKVFDK